MKKIIIIIALVLLGVGVVGVYFVRNFASEVIETPEPPIALPTTPTNQCGIENCHGLDIVCGSKPRAMCSMLYELGDRCRSYAECGVVGGVCQQIVNQRFTTCKACVEECRAQYPNRPDQVFACESRCGGE